MQLTIQKWLSQQDIVDPNYTEPLALAVGVVAVLAATILIYFVSYFVVRRLIQNGLFANSRFQFVRRLGNTKLFSHINYVIVGFAAKRLIDLWLIDSATSRGLTVLIEVWLLLIVLFALFAMLDALTNYLFDKGLGGKFPVRGLVQTVKLLASIGIGIVAISLLIGQSPFILLSGLGAMTAVLMLVFKDPILGLVAGIQLSANNMLNVGDWLEMPKYNADGDVIDIGLTTVKVRNWDNTVTTIPTYALIAESFKNWRPMSESGARRIKRAVMIDVNTVKFIDDTDVNRLVRSPILADYMISKSKELEEANKEADMSLALNGRRLTNLGTFRAYIELYLRNHPKIRQDVTLMVRQLAPVADGIPLEIYCFSNDVAWVNYEKIQADIFDHVFAVVSEFELRIHQNPSGYDMRMMGLGQKG